MCAFDTISLYLRQIYFPSILVPAPTAHPSILISNPLPTPRGCSRKAAPTPVSPGTRAMLMKALSESGEKKVSILDGNKVVSIPRSAAPDHASPKRPPPPASASHKPSSKKARSQTPPTLTPADKDTSSIPISTNGRSMRAVVKAAGQSTLSHTEIRRIVHEAERERKSQAQKSRVNKRQGTVIKKARNASGVITSPQGALRGNNYRRFSGSGAGVDRRGADDEAKQEEEGQEEKEDGLGEEILGKFGKSVQLARIGGRHGSSSGAGRTKSTAPPVPKPVPVPNPPSPMENDGTEDEDDEEDEDHAPSVSGRKDKDGKGDLSRSRLSFADLGVGVMLSTEISAVLEDATAENAVSLATSLRAWRPAFPRWRALLKAGHSLLFTGLGSKQHLLRQFDDVGWRPYTRAGVLHVRGYLDWITAREIVGTAVQQVLGTTGTHNWKSIPIREMTKLLESRYREQQRRGLVPTSLLVVIHALDGPGLRRPEEQEALSHLAACPNIYVAASTLHINAPLLWSKATASRFRWVPVMTHTAYAALEETGASRMDDGRFGTKTNDRSLEALRVLLQAVSVNTRRVFFELCRMLDANRGVALPLAALVDACVVKMLANTQGTVLTHLHEFVDHGWVSLKRAAKSGKEMVSLTVRADRVAEVLSTVALTMQER